MVILAWIIFGALAGWIASKLMGEDDRLGWFGNIVVGIAGAFLGNWIWSFFRAPQDGNQFDIGSLIIAIIGACILLAIVRAFTRKRPTV